MKFFKKSALLILATCVIGTSCKKSVVADVEIRYEVELSNTDREVDITYTNTTNGEDVVYDHDELIFTKTFKIPSDSDKQTFRVEAYCPAKFEGNQLISQTVTTRIYEGDKLIDEEIIGGTSIIYSSRTRISASLPTKTIYE